MRARRHAKAGKRKPTVTVTIIRPGRCTPGRARSANGGGSGTRCSYISTTTRRVPRLKMRRRWLNCCS